MIPRPLYLLTLGAFVLYIRCGPLAVEAGRGLLLSAPVILLVTALVLALLLRLWRRRLPDLRFPTRALLVTGLVQLAAGLMVLWPAIADNHMRWAGMGLWLFGCSYLSVTLVAWRLLLHLRPRAATTWAPLSVMAFYWLPAIPLNAEWLPDSVARAMEGVWVVPGFFGLVTGPLLLGLLVEAWLRNRPRNEAIEPEVFE